MFYLRLDKSDGPNSIPSKILKLLSKNMLVESL